MCVYMIYRVIINILTLEYDGLEICSDKRSKHYSINELKKVNI